MKSIAKLAFMTVVMAVTAGNLIAENATVMNYELSDPVTYKNLTVYFILNQNAFDDENMLTLEDAIRDGKVIVHETGEVQDLKIENKSDSPVFIQSGDIIKGGRQDRAIRYDMILPPKSGELSLPSFCVEQGRWSKRGYESAGYFNSSANMVASKSLKMAINTYGDQGKVWSEVNDLQEDLSNGINEPARSRVSESSLQLSLENDKVVNLSKEYIDAIWPKINAQENAVGFLFLINNQINSADIYRSNELFGKMWPKLIEATAIEALANPPAKSASKMPSIDDLNDWLHSGDNLGGKAILINDLTSMLSNQLEKVSVFKTIYTLDNSIIHLSIFSK